MKNTKNINTSATSNELVENTKEGFGYTQADSPKEIVVDIFSLLPTQVAQLYIQSSLGGPKIVILPIAEDNLKDKLLAFIKGNEFTPEYYELSQQLEISLEEFRNGNIIQKAEGFKNQTSDKSFLYIKKEGKWSTT